jgi:hypothetical protein
MCQIDDQVEYKRSGSPINPASIHNKAWFESGSKCEMKKAIITLTVALGGQTIGRMMTSRLLVVVGCLPEHAITVVLIYQSLL